MSSAALHTMQTVRPLLKRHPWIVAATIVTGVLATLAEGIGLGLFIPLLHSVEADTPPETGTWFIDAAASLFSDRSPNERMLLLTGGIVAAIFVRTALAYIRDVLYGLLEARLGHHVRATLFDQLVQVGYRFWESNDHDRLSNTVANESWRLVQAVALVVYLVITISALCVYIALLLLISWPLTIIAAVCLGGVMFATRGLRTRVERLGRAATRANVGLTRRLLETFGGMEVIRTFGQTRHEQERFNRASKRVSRIGLWSSIWGGLITPIYEMVAMALLVLILVGLLYSSASLSAALVFVLVLYRLKPRIRDLDGTRVALAAQAGGVEAVASVLNRADKPYLPNGTETPTALQNELRLENVTFQYTPGDAPALNNVSFSCPVGKTTALVGPSGSGKSTLIKLLLRLYDPTQGTIYVDSQPLTAFKVEAWRAHIGVVSQNTHVFNDTVRANIAYGKPDASLQAIKQAAREAQAHAFIEALPRGYETRVGDQGARLSGGQRQRIALARALLRDADLLILDEATSAVDGRSDAAIQRTLAESNRNRTILVVAHRLSSIMHADHVITLHDGELGACGSLDTLLNTPGLVADLYGGQSPGATCSTSAAKSPATSTSSAS